MTFESEVDHERARFVLWSRKLRREIAACSDEIRKLKATIAEAAELDSDDLHDSLSP